MFKLNSLVLNLKTDCVYIITALPDPLKLLEYCAEPYYEYKMQDSDPSREHPTWCRRQSEFEDGRFIAVSRNELLPCPLCREEPEVINAGANLDIKLIVSCQCGLTLFKNPVGKGFSSKEEAIKAWNSRKKPSKALEEG